jgi:hypothetical protein
MVADKSVMLGIFQENQTFRPPERSCDPANNSVQVKASIFSP